MMVTLAWRKGAEVAQWLGPFLAWRSWASAVGGRSLVLVVTDAALSQTSGVVAIPRRQARFGRRRVGIGLCQHIIGPRFALASGASAGFRDPDAVAGARPRHGAIRLCLCTHRLGGHPKRSQAIFRRVL